MNRHKIGFFDLIVVSKGTLHMGEGEHAWEVREKEALIVRPDKNHFGTAPCEEDTEIIWIHFNTLGAWAEYPDIKECLEDRFILSYRHRQTAHLSHSDVSSIFIPKYITLTQKAEEILAEFFTLDQESRSLRNWKRQSVFQQLMQNLDKEMVATPDLTAIQLSEQIDSYIRQNYRSKVTNGMLQKELNYHPNYLAKCMHKVYGMTPMQYLVHHRIEQAKKLLCQTRWPLSRIAEEVGFPDGSYFSASFSKKEGVTPTEFRRKYIENR